MVKKHKRNRGNLRSAMVLVDHDQLDRLEAFMETELPAGLKVPVAAQVRMALERFLKAQGV